MASGLLASLPQPRQAQPAAVAVAAPVTTLAVQKEAPPYLRRAGFVPRKPEDFGDGGAFPEIHVAQYPLEMGRDAAARGAKTLAISVDADGDVSYDAILRQGANRDRTIYSDHKALVPKVDLLDPKVWGGADGAGGGEGMGAVESAKQRVVRAPPLQSPAARLSRLAGAAALPE
jgi:SNW domain-containing protein 1